MTPDLEYPGVLVQEVPTCVRASVLDSVLLFSASSAKSRTGNAIKTDSQKNPWTVSFSVRKIRVDSDNKR